MPMATRNDFTMTAILSKLPYHAIVVSVLYLTVCLLVRYLVPQCEHVEAETEEAEVVADAEIKGGANRCGTEGVDNTVLAFSTDFFIAILLFCLALHLVLTTSRRFMSGLAFISLSLGFLCKGMAVRFFGNSGMDDGKGMEGFFFISMFQYLLWTTSTVFVGFLVHAAWGLVKEESRICGSHESKIAAALNVLSALVLTTGCLWNGIARWNLTEVMLDEYSTLDSQDVMIPFELFRIGQLAWHGSYCLFLVASAYVLGALANQEAKHDESFSKHGSAAILLASQIALGAFVVYYALKDGTDLVKGWSASDGSSVSSTFINYFLMISSVSTHDLLYNLFPHNEEHQEGIIDTGGVLQKSARDGMESDTDEIESSDDDSERHAEDGFYGDIESGERGHPSSLEERPHAWFFYMFPLFRRERYDMMDDETKSAEEEVLEGPGGTKIVIRTISSVSVKSQPAPALSSKTSESEYIQFQPSVPISVVRSEDESLKRVADEACDESASSELVISTSGESVVLDRSVSTFDRSVSNVESFVTSSSQRKESPPEIQIPLADEELETAERLEEVDEVMKPSFFHMFRRSLSKKNIESRRSLCTDDGNTTTTKEEKQDKSDDLSSTFAGLDRNSVSFEENVMRSNTHSSHTRDRSITLTDENIVEVEETLTVPSTEESDQLSSVEGNTTVLRISELDPSLSTQAVEKDRKNRFLNRLRKKHKAVIVSNSIEKERESDMNSALEFPPNELVKQRSLQMQDSFKTSQPDDFVVCCASSHVTQQTNESQEECVETLGDSDSTADIGAGIEMTYEETQECLLQLPPLDVSTCDDETVPANPSMNIVENTPFMGLENEKSMEIASVAPALSTRKTQSNIEDQHLDGVLPKERSAISEEDMEISNLQSQSEFTSEYSRSQSSSGSEFVLPMEEEVESFRASLLHVLNPFKKNEESFSDASSSGSEASSIGIGTDYVVSFESSKFSAESGASYSSFSDSRSGSDDSSKHSSSGLKLTWSAFERQSPTTRIRSEADQSKAATVNVSNLSKHRMSQLSKASL